MNHQMIISYENPCHQHATLYSEQAGLLTEEQEDKGDDGEGVNQDLMVVH